MQSDAPVGARRGMNKALMKTVPRRKLAPVTHRITNVMTSGVACCGRYDGISLHAKAVLAGAFLFLFGVNGEIAARRRLVRQTNRGGHRHQAAVAFHHIDVLFRERNFDAHSRRIMRAVGSHVVCLGTCHASRPATSKQ